MGKECRNKRFSSYPTADQLREELEREKGRHSFGRAIRGTIYALLIVAAASVLIATLVMPVYRIYGTSMTPTLDEGDIVAAVKTGDCDPGDLVAFYYNNKILVKRVIARAGDWVDIGKDGTVYVNDRQIDEPYVQNRSLGETDINLPYQVPEGKLFVMGDHRDVSIDSRKKEIGCISSEQISGKIVLRIWPLNRIGRV